MDLHRNWFPLVFMIFPAEPAVVLAGEDAVGVEFVEVLAVLAVSVDQLEVDGTPQSSVVELTEGRRDIWGWIAMAAARSI